MKRNSLKLKIAACAIVAIGYTVIALSATTSPVADAGRSDATPTVDHFLPFVSHYVTPTPVPSVDVVAEYSWTTRVSLFIVGEVQNNTPDPIEYIRMTASLYDAQRHLLGTYEEMCPLRGVAPGERSCFELAIFIPPANWAYYELEPSNYLRCAARPALVPVGFSGARQADGNYSLLGYIRNDEPVMVRPQGAAATLYDAQGHAIGCSSALMDTFYLQAGQSVAASFIFRYRDYADVASYRVQAHGYRLVQSTH